MSDFLEQMAKSSRDRVSAIQVSFTDDELDRPVRPLQLAGFDMIAEIKNRSPAEGELAASDENRVDRACRYVAGGAAAISVLTEPECFDGELLHLEEVANAVDVPVMRKDFLVDPIQVLEAKAAGASGVLLIAAMLDRQSLTAMLDCAFEHGLFVLLESFDQANLALTSELLEQSTYRERAEKAQLFVGVNTRNLRTLQVDPDRLEDLGPLLPESAIAVAESGLHTSDDARAVVGWGYRMALVGTALMRADDPTGLIASMLAAGRAA